MTDWFNKTSVKLLSGADFDNKEPWKLRNKKCCFILFFAEWCGHCQNIKPEYIKFADIAQFIKVYAVNSETDSTLMEKLGSPKSPVHIQGFPTIWIYSHGEPYSEYTGPRTWQAMLAAAQKVCKADCNC